MHLVGLHVAHEVVDDLGLGDEHRVAHEVVDGQAAGVGAQVRAAQDVLEVDDAQEVVGGLPHHRHPGESGAGEQGHGLVQARVPADGDHVRARHHHLADERVVEVEDGLEELAVVLVEDDGLRDPFDHDGELVLPDLLRLLGARLPFPDGARGDRGDGGRRPGDQAEGLDGSAQADARRRGDGHEGGDAREDPREGQGRLPPRGHHAGQGEGQEQGCEGGEDDAQEDQARDGSLAAGDEEGDAPGPARPGGLGFDGLVAGDAAERRPARRAQSLQGEGEDGADDQRAHGDVGSVHVSVGSGATGSSRRWARKVSRSLRWRSNISLRSSSRAWS